MTEFEKILDLETSLRKGQLTQIYKMLLQNDMEPNKCKMEKWAQECHRQLTQQDWGAYAALAH